MREGKNGEEWARGIGWTLDRENNVDLLEREGWGNYKSLDKLFYNV